MDAAIDSFLLTFPMTIFFEMKRIPPVALFPKLTIWSALYFFIYMLISSSSLLDRSASGFMFSIFRRTSPPL
jgi:hypothetical protein